MGDESERMPVDSLNIQVFNHQSLKYNLPVIEHAGSSGKGFPYAPEDFPSPGDAWTWHVGKRCTAAGFWQDRSVHPPDHLQSSTGNKVSFRGRPSLEQYIRKTFPDADVDAFFASFVWKIPCTNGAKDASLQAIESKGCSKSAAIVRPGNCKASNEMCLIKAKTGSALAPATCNICCTEPNFCRNCCCILCSKTIDWIYDGYSFIKCEALVDENFICGHVAHIECALRACLAGKVGGSIDLDAQYYCRHCDNKIDLLLHVQKIIKVSDSIDNKDDMVKVLNLGFCMLRGSRKERAEKLRNHIATSIEKLKHGVLSEDIRKKRSVISELGQGYMEKKKYMFQPLEENVSRQQRRRSDMYHQSGGRDSESSYRSDRCDDLPPDNVSHASPPGSIPVQHLEPSHSPLPFSLAAPILSRRGCSSDTCHSRSLSPQRPRDLPHRTSSMPAHTSGSQQSIERRQPLELETSRQRHGKAPAAAIESSESTSPQDVVAQMERLRSEFPDICFDNVSFAPQISRVSIEHQEIAMRYLVEMTSQDNEWWRLCRRISKVSMDRKAEIEKLKQQNEQDNRIMKTLMDDVAAANTSKGKARAEIEFAKKQLEDEASRHLCEVETLHHRNKELLNAKESADKRTAELKTQLKAALDEKDRAIKEKEEATKARQEARDKVTSLMAERDGAVKKIEELEVALDDVVVDTHDALVAEFESMLEKCNANLLRFRSLEWIGEEYPTHLATAWNRLIIMEKEAQGTENIDLFELENKYLREDEKRILHEMRSSSPKK